MARLKLKQVLSNLHYDRGRDQLTISQSFIPVGDELFDSSNQAWNDAVNTWQTDEFLALIISGTYDSTDPLYIKTKEVMSHVTYDGGKDQITISSSLIPIGEQAFNQATQTWEGAFNTWQTSDFPLIVVSGSIKVSDSLYQTGSITITNADTFGDSGSFYSMDLGTY